MRTLAILAAAVLDLYLANGVEPIPLKLALAGSAVLALTAAVLPLALRLVNRDPESRIANEINRALRKSKRRKVG